MRKFLALTLVLFLSVPAAVHAANVLDEGTPVHVVPYRVQAGDTTGAIAEYFYGDMGKATRIAYYNKLQNVNRIAVGQELQIPFYTWEDWQAYAKRTGQEITLPPTTEIEGGSQDVTVAAKPEAAKEHGSARGKLLVAIIYTSLVVALSFALYLRSRRHEYRALGMGTGR